ncbi:MAG TPA: ATPase domain-containing protein, partial [Phycisphaerales bacterium]|nr:ATPase domain-containing protein [Phycisphaerales bacterium]
LPADHLYLVEGDPGAGKTTLSIQFLLEGLARGEKGLYITLSESGAEIDKIARSHGWNLTGLDVQELGHSIEAAMGDDHYTVFRPSDVELAETTKKILAMVETGKPRRVVIDSLSELRLLAHEPLRYRRQILGLKNYFSTRACTVMLLDDRTVQTSDLQPQSIAHGVIELDRMANEYGAERRRLRVAKLRGRAFRGGYHDFAIRTGGLVVFPRLASVREEKACENDGPALSGMPEFDTLLGGGLDRGTSTLLTGPAGTGKSTLAMKLVDAACRRGEKAAVFAFEESKRIMLSRAKALGIQYAQHLENGLLSFRHIVPAELSPGEFAALVREAVEKDGARLVVIDSLNGYLNSMPEEGFLTAQLHEVLGYLNGQGVVTVMVLAQRGMMGAGMTAPVDVSYLADTVVMLRHFEAFGAVHKAISVVKKRTGSHEETIRELLFTGGRLGVGKVLSDFRGVLTGVPVYTGTQEGLDHRGGDDGRD